MSEVIVAKEQEAEKLIGMERNTAAEHSCPGRHKSIYERARKARDTLLRHFTLTDIRASCTKTASNTYVM